MKTSKQIVVQTGGPYRSLDLWSRERRMQLIREIDFLESIQEWQKYDKHGKLLKDESKAIRYLVAIGWGAALTGLLYATALLFAGASYLRAIVLLLFLAAGLFVTIRDNLPTIRLMLYWRPGSDPAPLIRQKLDELANLPPE